MLIGTSKLKSLCLLAVIVLASAASAQTFNLDASRLPITQIDSTWRFHLGDDPRWSQPTFDDTTWPTLHPEDDWAPQGYPVKNELAWFRFRLIAPAHTASLVLEMPAFAKSFQLFCNGKRIAQVGTLPPGPAHNVISAPRVFTLPVDSGADPKEISIALRLWQDPAIAGTRASNLQGAVFAGSSDAVLDHFATERSADLLSDGSTYTSDVIIVILGAATALLFWQTRERFYLWFAFYLFFEACYLPLDLLSAHWAWDFYFSTYLQMVVDLFAQVTLIGFIVSALYPDDWRPILIPSALALCADLSLALVLNHLISLQWADIGYGSFNFGVSLLLGTYLIRGWRRGNLYAKLLFFPFVIDALSKVLNNLAGVLLDLNFPSAVTLIPYHHILLNQPFRVSFADLTNLISLLGLLAVLVYRFARTSRDQQRLSSALQAAHDIQNRLVPIKIPTLGGLTTEIAYHAAEEVGGDFCQILPRSDGSILVAIGDVSGKGLQAAMLGAVAVGALRSLADENISPAIVLERLNRVLFHSGHGGFTTCLCLILMPTGEITIANAGHLSPYLDGAEVNLQSGLPLGIVPEIDFDMASFRLPDASRLTLLSDGVVEARSPTGELFGFDRTTFASRSSASEIAATALRFGQEDDITVITLDWARSLA